MSDQHHGPGNADTEHDQHVVESLGYEARDLIGKRRTIFYFAALHFGGLLITGIVVYGAYLLLERFSPTFDPNTREGQQVVSDAAKLQADPGPDMDAYLHKANDKLNNYGWVDEAAGKVHIPIDEAMRRTADMNLPHRAEAPE